MHACIQLLNRFGVLCKNLQIRSDFNCFQISTENKGYGRKASSSLCKRFDDDGMHHIVITRSGSTVQVGLGFRCMCACAWMCDQRVQTWVILP